MNIEKNIVTNFPYPIALTFKNFINLSNSDDTIELKHRVLGNLIESIIRYMGAIAISQYTADGYRDKDIDAILSAIFDSSSSLDQWNIILKNILRYYRENEKKFLVPELDGFYFEKKKDEFINLTSAYKELNSILNDGERELRQISFSDFATRLLKYHFTFWENKYSNLTKKQLKKHVLLLEPAIEEILENLNFLTEYKLVYVASEDEIRKDNQYNIQLHMGSSIQFPIQSLRASKELETKKIYLCDFKKFIPILKLYPFLVLEYCAPCSYGQIFFFKENNKNALRYKSFQCGHEFSPCTYLADLQSHLSSEESIFDETENKKAYGKGFESSPQTEDIYKTALELALTDGPLSLKKIEKLEFFRNRFNIQQTRAQEMLKNIEASSLERISDQELSYIETIRSAFPSIPTSLIYNQYPYPIAHNYWQITHTSEDFRMILKCICNLLGSTLKYLSSILVSQYIRDKIDNVNVNLHLEKLVEPSLVEWLLFMEDILKLYQEKNEKLIIGDIYKFYFSKQNSWDSVLKAYKTISKDEFFLFKGDSDLDSISPAEFFKVIPDLVDTVEYYGDDLSINQIKNLLATLIPAVDEFMKSLKFLVAYKLFYVKKAAYEKGKVRHEIIDCMGAINLEETEYFSENYFAQERVYLSSTIEKDFPVLNLSPFFVMNDYPSGSRVQLFFYQKVTGDGGLEYNNYQGDIKFTSQEYARDLVKAFRKFTSEKKINLVIKLLDWQKEKRRRDSDKKDRTPRSTLTINEEQRKIQDDAKKAVDIKKQIRNSYRFALEAAWSDGVLSEDERVYLDELQRVLNLSSADIKLIEDSTEAKFAVKIDRSKLTSKKQEELEQNLEFLEEEHQMLLKSLEDRRQQIRTLEKALKTFQEERDICRDNTEEAEKEKLEKENENSKLKRLLKEFKAKLDATEKNAPQSADVQQLEKKLRELDEGKKLRDKKIEKLTEDFSKSSEQVNKLKSELLDSKNKITAFQKEIKDLEFKINTSEKTDTARASKLMSEKESQIEDLKNKLHSLEDRNYALEKQLEEALEIKEDLSSAKADEFETIKEGYQREIEIIKKRLEEQIEEKSNTEKNLIIANKKKDTLLKLVQELKKNFDELKKSTVKSKDLEVLKDKIKNLEQENKELLDFKETREHENATLAQELDKVRSESLTLREEHHASIDEKEALLNLVNNLRKNTDKVISDNQDRAGLVDELEKRLGELEMEKAQLLNSNDKQAQKIKGVFGQLNELKNEKVKLEVNLTELGKEKLASEEKLEKLLREFATAKNFITQAKLKVAEYEKLGREFNNLNIEKENILNEKNALEENVGNLTERLEESNRQINAMEASFSNLTGQKDELEEIRSNLEKQLLDVTQQAEQAEEVSGERNKLIQRLKDFEREKKELVKNNEKQKSKIIELVKKGNASMEEHNKSIVLMDTLKSEKEELLQLNQGLQERLMHFENEFVSSEDEISEYKEYKKKFEDIEKENTFLFQSLESKTARIQELEEELKHSEGLSGNIEEDYGSLEKEKYETELNAYGAKLSDAENKIKELNDKLQQTERLPLQKEKYETELNAYSAKLSDAENKIKELNDKLQQTEGLPLQKEKYETELNAYGAKLSDAENKIKELNDKLQQTEGVSTQDASPDAYLNEKLRMIKNKLEHFEEKERERLKEERRKKKVEIKRRTDELRKLKEEWNKIKDEKEEIKKLKEEHESKLLIDFPRQNIQINPEQEKLLANLREELEKEKRDFELKKVQVNQEQEKLLANLREELEKEKRDFELKKVQVNQEQEKLLAIFREELEKEKRDFELKKENFLQDINKQQEELKEKQKEFASIKVKLEKTKVALGTERARIEQGKASLGAEFEGKKKELTRLQKEIEDRKALLEEEKKLIQDKLPAKQDAEWEIEKQEFLEKLTKLEAEKSESEALSLKIQREKDDIISTLKHEFEEMKMTLEETSKSGRGLEGEIEGERKELDEGWDELAREKAHMDAERDALERERIVFKELTPSMEELEGERKELDEGWDELARERAHLDAEREAILQEKALPGQLNDIGVDAFEAEKRELENGWIELAEERQKLRVLREEIEKSFLPEELMEKGHELELMRKEVETEWNKLEEEKAKFDTELKLLEQERMFISNRKTELEKTENLDDIEKSITARSTLVLKKGEIDNFLGQYLSKEELEEFQSTFEGEKTQTKEPTGDSDINKRDYPQA